MIASAMILIGSLMVLGLAGYWMRRAVKAEGRVARLEAENCELLDAWNVCAHRCLRIIALETDRMAHVGKKAVAIARGER